VVNWRIWNRACFGVESTLERRKCHCVHRSEQEPIFFWGRGERVKGGARQRLAGEKGKQVL